MKRASTVPSTAGLYGRNYLANAAGDLVIVLLNLFTPIEFFKEWQTFLFQGGGGRLLAIFFPAIFILATVLQYIIQRPIVSFIQQVRSGRQPAADLQLRARRRLVNLPLILAVVNLIMWTAVTLLFMLVLYLITSIGVITAVYIFFRGVIIGFMASFLSFFLIDDYNRTRLVPVFFPHGRLAEVPGTVKISIHRKIRVLYSAGTAFSMAILMGTLLLLQWQMEDALVSAVDFGRGIVVFTGVLFAIFIVVALGLHLMVTKTISAPVKAMMALVRKVRRGEFQHKVQVVSNDELGVLGDGMNEMTEGLLERERMRRSLHLAREVQQALLPRHPPDVSGLDISGASVYCDETGGDYFDFIASGQKSIGSVGVVIGDVAGHGISAALLMATARAFLRQRSVQPGSLARVVSDVNRLLAHDVEDTGGFMTLFYLTIDGKQRKLGWVRAGHDPAILYDPVRDVFEPLGGAGIALGINPDARYEHYEKDKLAKGQIILLATDGVWEARNPDGEMFGKDSICRVVRQNAAVSAGEILTAVFDNLNRHAGSQRPEDDMTMIVIKVTDD